MCTCVCVVIDSVDGLRGEEGGQDVLTQWTCVCVVVIDSVDGLRGEEGGQDVYMCVWSLTQWMV